jgi:hypothetical protein
MRLRWPVAASLAPVGLIIGALMVGFPSSVPDDVRLIAPPSTTVPTTVPTTTPTTGTAPADGSAAPEGSPQP